MGGAAGVGGRACVCVGSLGAERAEADRLRSRLAQAREGAREAAESEADWEWRTLAAETDVAKARQKTALDACVRSEGLHLLDQLVLHCPELHSAPALGAAPAAACPTVAVWRQEQLLALQAASEARAARHARVAEETQRALLATLRRYQDRLHHNLRRIALLSQPIPHSPGPNSLTHSPTQDSPSIPLSHSTQLHSLNHHASPHTSLPRNVHQPSICSTSEPQLSPSSSFLPVNQHL